MNRLRTTPTQKRKHSKVIHNFSSYKLTINQEKALSESLDQHIPSTNDSTQLQAQFETFYCKLTDNLSDISTDNNITLKTKLLDTYVKYNDIQPRYPFKNEMDNLRRNKSLTLIRQDKGRGVVILERNDYNEKCKRLLNTNQFSICTKDPTKTTEGKVQRAVRKIKPALTTKEYQQIYPSGSNPGRMYGTAKIHKMKPNDTIKELTLRPIISNIGTATYQLAKYLAKLLSPLSKSIYTVNSTDDFINLIRNLDIPEDHLMISFDVVSLFSNVPLDYTINSILRRIYDNKEITSTISRPDMKTLLELCTSNVHFTFDNTIYIQTDGVAMGSPLGPVLAGAFMTDLENTLLPTLSPQMRPWHRYVDDTFTTIRKDSITSIITKLNDFHPNIQFTYEIEEEHQLAFLDVKLIRENRNIETTVHRKTTHNEIYMRWDSFTPHAWRVGTLKTLLIRAFKVCSNEEHRNHEIKHIKKIFLQHGYPEPLISKTISDIEDGLLSNNEPQPNTTHIHLNLPYKGKQGEKLIHSLNNTLQPFLKDDTITRYTYNGQRLGSIFSSKDKINREHQHNLIYRLSCPNVGCDSTYIGETARRLSERVKEHSGKGGQTSHMSQHTAKLGHMPISLDDTEILATVKGGTKLRKTIEALIIKQNKPDINKQEASIPITLF